MLKVANLCATNFKWDMQKYTGENLDNISKTNLGRFKKINLK